MASRVEITFRSGAKVRVDVDEWTTRRAPGTGELVSIEWKHATQGRARGAAGQTGRHPTRDLTYIRVEDVAAVVLVDDPEAVGR